MFASAVFDFKHYGLNGLALLWQILSAAGFPNQFFCDLWAVGFWRADPASGNWPFLPSAEAYCQATPTECLPFFGTAVSSITNTASLPPTSLSA